MSSMFNPDYVRRASMSAFGAFISFSGSFFVIIVTREHYGSDFTITVASVGAVFGLISVASAGFSVHTLMTTAKSFGILRSDSADDEAKAKASSALRSATTAEFRPAITMILLIGAAAVLLSLFGPQLFAVDPGYFYPYWWPYLLILLAGPFVAVVSGLTQAAAQDGFGLWVSILSTGLTVASAVIGMAIGLDAPVALTVIGLTSLVVQSLNLALRLKRLLRFRIGIITAARNAFAGFAEAGRTAFSPIPQFLSTVDGFVFMLTFTTAISVAAHHSQADGEMVAIIVSLLRSLIVPTKQLGIIGGRMSKQGTLGRPSPQDDNSSAEVDPALVRRLNLRTVQFSAATITTVTAAVALVLMVTGVVHVAPILIVVLVTAQLLLEPWAGILFSFLKVASGPKAGLVALIVSYVGLGLGGLALIAIVDLGGIVVIWSWLFVVRLVFIVLTVRAAKFWVRG